MSEEALDIPAGRIERPLNAGWVEHWLTAGPDPALAERVSIDFQAHAPVEGAAVDGKNLNTYGVWQALGCTEDHLLHLDVRAGAGGAAGAWLCVVLEAPQAYVGELVLAHSQYVEVWINGVRHGAYGEKSGGAGSEAGNGVSDGVDAVPAWDTVHSPVVEDRLTIDWQAGRNEVRLYTRRAQAGRWAIGARVAQADTGPDAGVVIETSILPTALSPVERREKLDAILAQAYVEQDVFHAKERIRVKWPATSQLYDSLTVRLQAPNRRIYAEGNVDAAAGADIPISWPEQLSDGRYDVVVMPKSEDYYTRGMRIVRRIPIRTAGSAHSTNYYGDYAGRRQEALENAARHPGLFAQIAAMALGRWDRLDAATVERAIEQVQDRQAGFERLLLGLLGMSHRYAGSGHLPQAWGKAIVELAATLAQGQRQGPPAQSNGAEHAPAREDAAIINAATEILAGQLLAQGEADSAGLLARGEESALAWLRARAARGFGLWDSPIAFEGMIAALSHLADLAQNEEVAEMAAVVLDKLMFTIGANSFQGVFGSTHAETTASMIFGHGLDAVSGPARLAWGKGAFNQHLVGTVGLACAAGYELPEVIAATAVDAATTVAHRERHAVIRPDNTQDEVHKLTYKSPAGMLSSVLDYRPGEAGRSEHIWQATLGPGAIVFVNHPALGADAEDEVELLLSGRTTGPGFWRGNGVLPRVAQAGDLLAAWYRLLEDDRMGFTHAYFPRAAFDEHYITEQWAFGRKGSGYVALYAAPGLTPIEEGPGARRELRAYGREVFWLCRIGNAEQDGSFEDFRANAEAATVSIESGVARARNLWGRDLAFGWEGPLRMTPPDSAGDALAAQPLRHELHYESEFCRADFPAETMEISYKGHVMRLDVG